MRAFDRERGPATRTFSVLGVDPGLTRPGFYRAGTALTLRLEGLDQFEALGLLAEHVEGELLRLAGNGLPLLVACENLVLPRFGSGMKTLLAQGCIRTTVRRLAMTRLHQEVRWLDVPPASLKRFAVGSGRADKGQVFQAAVAAGAMVSTEDEADAYWCWRIGSLYDDPEWGGEDTPVTWSATFPKLLEV